ncbi:MAG: FtsW/RodA/SpoVE family cell cycle protein, partial [Eubacterium sp.]|nr:FtsW/RodA/SpoVE family cell cycle protein [Eubacterium sp.]
GIGKGNIRNYFQNYLTTTDDVFGLICEEWGFLFAIVLVLSFAAIAVSAIVNSIAARSAFYSITAVAGAGMLLFQTALNIFGITDVLPLTGVTLPFVSQGGSSMLCCWAVLAFIKASDVRTYNYLGGAKKK